MENTNYDLAIVGSGPAGLSAAINATIRKKSVVVFGSAGGSKKILSSPRIDNYLGFPGIPGKELYEKFLSHAGQMGIEPLEQRVDKILPEGEGYLLTVQSREYRARAIILTTGAFPANFLPGEKELLGLGVSYCATCDGPLFSGKTVAMISSGPDGEGEADFLAELCKEVYYVPLYTEVGSLTPKVKLIQEKPKAIQGGQMVTGLELEGRTLPVDGVFLYREADPPDTLLPGLELDKTNHIKINAELETSSPGVFAAGDCIGRPYQIARAVGQGLTAGLNAVAYLDK